MAAAGIGTVPWRSERSYNPRFGTYRWDTYLHVWDAIGVYIHTYMYIYIYGMSTYVYTFIYIYIVIYIYMYICIKIYTYNTKMYYIHILYMRLGLLPRDVAPGGAMARRRTWQNSRFHGTFVRYVG